MPEEIDLNEEEKAALERVWKKLHEEQDEEQEEPPSDKKEE